jgi:hypothetical protein
MHARRGRAGEIFRFVANSMGSEEGGAGTDRCLAPRLCENAQARPLRSFAEGFPIRRAGWAGDCRPHRSVQCLADGSPTVCLRQWEVGLLEVQRAVGHVGEVLAAFGSNHPTVLLSFDVGPCRHEAFGAVGQCPGGPIRFVEAEPASQPDRVDAESLKHVVIDDRQLLDDVVDAGRTGGRPRSRRSLG